MNNKCMDHIILSNGSQGNHKYFTIMHNEIKARLYLGNPRCYSSIIIDHKNIF